LCRTVDTAVVEGLLKLAGYG